MQQFWHEVVIALTPIGTIIGIYLTQRNIQSKTNHDIMQDNLNDLYEQIKTARENEQKYHDEYYKLLDSVDKFRQELSCCKAENTKLKAKIAILEGEK